MANLLRIVMGAFAPFALGLIRERQREGVELAEKAVAYRGRKHSLKTDRVAELRLRLVPGKKVLRGPHDGLSLREEHERRSSMIHLGLAALKHWAREEYAAGCRALLSEIPPKPPITACGCGWEHADTEAIESVRQNRP